MTNSQSKHVRNEVFDNYSLWQAVNLWFFDREAAIRKHGHISTWNTSEVTVMRGLFRNATNFNDDIGRWDTSKVTDMSFLFCGASSFDQYIGDWKVGNVRFMQYMFAHAISFNQDIGDWDVSSAIDMSGMFLGPYTLSIDVALERHRFELINSDEIPMLIGDNNDMTDMFRHDEMHNYEDWMSHETTNGHWNVSRPYYAFDLISNHPENGMLFNKDIGRWNVSNVRRMTGMFECAIEFDQNLDDWNLINVTDTKFMFFGAIAFNGKIVSWNVQNVENMNAMFKYAFAFDQYLGHWSFDKVVMKTTERSNDTLENKDFINGTTLERRLNGESLFNKYAMDKLFPYERRKDFLMFLVNRGYIPYQGTYQSGQFHKIFSNDDMRQLVMSFV